MPSCVTDVPSVSAAPCGVFRGSAGPVEFAFWCDGEKYQGRAACDNGEDCYVLFSGELDIDCTENGFVLPIVDFDPNSCVTCPEQDFDCDDVPRTLTLNFKLMDSSSNVVVNENLVLSYGTYGNVIQGTNKYWRTSLTGACGYFYAIVCVSDDSGTKFYFANISSGIVISEREIPSLSTSPLHLKVGPVPGPVNIAFYGSCSVPAGTPGTPYYYYTAEVTE